MKNNTFYVVMEEWNGQKMPVDVAVDLADAEAKARDLKSVTPTSEFTVSKAKLLD